MKKHTPPPPNEMVLSYHQIRRSVGFLGVALAPGLVTINYIFGHCAQIQDSISHYYYTVAGSLLVGILCAVGLFLYTYRGFDNWDRWSSNFAALCAFGVAFSPCNTSPACLKCDVLLYMDNPVRNGIHYGSAVCLFVTLALMSLFLFTKTDKEHPGPRKKARNAIYRACGIIMVVSMIGMVSLLNNSIQQYIGRTALFVLETIALTAFGISWLVKGETVLKDKK
jgi:surface polysaccharide O-acyltransferase-like enzyme